MVVKSVSNDKLYNRTVLKNGLRVVSEVMPSVRSIALGVWVDVGSRSELPNENGLSHFVEHMLFKGTKKRNAKQIAASLESIGGGLNAYTSREQTCYLARFLDQHLPLAVDVLSDMLCNSTLTPVNLKREKQVICEEIKESLDSPTDQIHDLFAKTFWGSHPLGRPILGSIESVQAIPRAQMVNYIERNYRNGSIVITAAGSVNHRKLVNLVKRHFNFPNGVAPQPIEAKRDRERSLKAKKDKNSQTHLCIGFPGIHYTEDFKMSAMALNLYLGGGMSSVLFQKLREQRGLAYSVYTYLDYYKDSGVFGGYIGTDKDHLRPALDIMLKEFERMRKRKLNSLTLDQVKNQLKGSIMLSMESTASRMNRLGRQEIMYGRYYDLDETIAAVDRVTASDVMMMANRIFDRERMAVAVLGPTNNGDFDGLD